MDEARLRAYLAEVLRANEQFNLTAVRDEETAWVKHVEDSLAGLRSGLFEKPDRVIDIGTGPGFPGVILAIARPQMQVTLLESIAKKCRFLEEAVATHAPGTRVICERAEIAGHDPQFREKFNIATARAVGSLSEVCELAMPFVKFGGKVLLWRGQNAAEEVAVSTKAINTLGGEAQVLEEYRLPGHDTAYHLVVVKKVGATPSKYPRRVGVPKKQPL